MKWHEEDEAAKQAADQKYRGPNRVYKPDARLLDMVENAGGFVVHGRPVFITRADRRRNANGQVVNWALRDRPDVLTPVQAEALRLYYGGRGSVDYCVDADTGRALSLEPSLSQCAMELSPSNEAPHRHLRAPLSMAQAARYLGISIGAFRDRLQRAERSATNAWNYDAARGRREPIPDTLTKYRRRRVKGGRASTID